MSEHDRTPALTGAQSEDLGEGSDRNHIPSSASASEWVESLPPFASNEFRDSVKRTETLMPNGPINCCDPLSAAFLVKSTTMMTIELLEALLLRDGAPIGEVDYFLGAVERRSNGKRSP